VKRFFEKSTAAIEARKKIKWAIDRYAQSVSSLGTTIGIVLLENIIKQTKLEVIDWIWKEKDDPQRGHEWFQNNRAPNTGDWILRDEKFKSWVTKAGRSSLLLCHGMRTNLL